MPEAIDTRFDELISEGQALLHRGSDQYDQIPRRESEKYQAWLFSVLNLLQMILPDNNPYVVQAGALAHGKGRYIVETDVRKMFGLLVSAKEEGDRGLLRRIEYIIAASTFDDFLDHADDCHKRGQKEASGVLVSAVFEDTIRKIAAKNDMDAGQDVEQIIHTLVKQSIFTDVAAKRMQAASGLRNKALHSKWAEFDLSDVGMAIALVRDLIDKYL